MKKLNFLLFLGLFLLLSQGCATIVTGTSQTIRFNSNPKGAVVEHNGIQVGTTPCVATLSRSGAHSITFRKEGYELSHVQLNTTFNAWFLGNLLFGGIIGMIIDVATGSINWLTPPYVYVQLRSEKGEKEENENIK